MPYKDKKKRKEYLREYYSKNRIKLDKINNDWKKKNPNEARKIQKRDYAKNHEERIKKVTEYHKKNRKKINERQKLSRKKNLEKYKAGYLTKRTPLKKSCEICNSKDKLQRHHWRYDKPFMLSTLCKECHIIQHIGKFEESIYGGILIS